MRCSTIKTNISIYVMSSIRFSINCVDFVAFCSFRLLGVHMYKFGDSLTLKADPYLDRNLKLLKRLWTVDVDPLTTMCDQR